MQADKWNCHFDLLFDILLSEGRTQIPIYNYQSALETHLR